MSKILNQHEESAARAAYEEKHHKLAMSGGSVRRQIHMAGQFAKNSVTTDGLLPTLNKYREWTYTVQQGLKAACHTREDIIAVYEMHIALLKRVHFLQISIYVCFLMLLVLVLR